MTEFCGADVRLWGDLLLFVDGNSKITRENGSFAAPAPNAFSLPHISSCPGSTADCRAACYVHGLEKNAPEIFARYKLNAVALHRILLDGSDAALAAEIFGDWITINAPKGFRWHVSGDVMSRRHAEWIVEVCRIASGVPFWIYTRTFEIVPILTRAENLRVNLSADATNFFRAQIVHRENPGTVLTYFTRTGEILSDADVVFPDYPLRGRALDDPTSAPWWRGLTADERRKVCPADFFGQSESARCGPCKRCL